MNGLFGKIDEDLINLFQRLEIWFARFAIFLVYFWFGGLKLLGVSPASALVQALFERTLGFFMPFGVFYITFSFFEVIIGILFLVRGAERLAIVLLAIHLTTTALPLFLLPEVTWQGFLVPTLEGQYIIKNILIVAAAIVVGAKLMRSSSQKQ